MSVITSPEDRISDLPESVISHILSCVPTIDAIRTSILSKSWKHKWSSIYNIQIDDNSEYQMLDGRKSCFIRYVDNIFHSTQNSGFTSFRLKCKEGYDSDHLITWIIALLRRKVQILEINAYQCKTFNFPGWASSSCSSLKSLKLLLNCRIGVGDNKNCFLHLKSLSISGGYRPAEILNYKSNSGQMILHFPVMETLELIRCKWSHVKLVEIRAPELVDFRMKSIKVSTNDCIIKICGSKLKRLHTFGSKCLDNFVLCSESSLNAVLNHGETSELIGLRGNMLLKGGPTLMDLRLSGLIVKALIKATPQHILPTFHRLKVLNLEHGCDVREWLKILHQMQSLAFLTLCARSSGHNYHYEKVEYIPPCMSSLEQVTLTHFNGNKNHVELAKFFLKHGEKLDIVSVSGKFGLRSKEESVIRNTLLALPKSSNCAIRTLYVNHNCLHLVTLH